MSRGPELTRSRSIAGVDRIRRTRTARPGARPPGAVVPKIPVAREGAARSSRWTRRPTAAGSPSHAAPKSASTAGHAPRGPLAGSHAGARSPARSRPCISPPMARAWSRPRASRAWVASRRSGTSPTVRSSGVSRATATSSTTPNSRPDGKRLATCGYDKTIELWDAVSGKPLRTLEGHTGAVYDVGVQPRRPLPRRAPAPTTPARSGASRTASGMDTLPQPLKAEYTCAFSPDGRTIVAAGADNNIRVWQFVLARQAARSTRW